MGYSKGTKSWLFYDPKEHIVLVNTNGVFLEDDYKIDRKPNNRFNLRELFDTLKEPLERSSNPMEDIFEIIASSLLDT